MRPILRRRRSRCGGGFSPIVTFCVTRALRRIRCSLSKAVFCRPYFGRVAPGIPPRLSAEKCGLSILRFLGSVSPFLPACDKRVHHHSAHPQNTIKTWGFREHIFEKQLCVTKRPVLDPQNPNPEIPVINSFVLFLFSFNNKRHNNALKPLFL